MGVSGKSTWEAAELQTEPDAFLHAHHYYFTEQLTSYSAKARAALNDGNWSGTTGRTLMQLKSDLHT